MGSAMENEAEIGSAEISPVGDNRPDLSVVVLSSHNGDLAGSRLRSLLSQLPERDFPVAQILCFDRGSGNDGTLKGLKRCAIDDGRVEVFALREVAESEAVEVAFSWCEASKICLVDACEEMPLDVAGGLAKEQLRSSRIFDGSFLRACLAEPALRNLLFDDAQSPLRLCDVQARYLNEAYFHSQCRWQAAEIDGLQRRLAMAEKEINRVRSSRSFRIGCALTFVPRALKRLFRRKRDNSAAKGGDE